MYHGASSRASTAVRPPPQVGVVLPSRSLLGLDALARVATRAERAGVASIYLNESGNDALTAAAALLGRTERIVVATGIANIGVRHPFVVGMAAAELEALFPGRFRLGLGVGSASFNVEALGQSLQASIERLAEYSKVVRGVACGNLPVPHDGHFPVSRIDRHAPSVARITVDAAALRPPAVDALAPVVDGFLVNFVTPVLLAMLVDRAALSRGPLPANHFAAYVQLITAGRSSASEAEAAAADLVGRYAAHAHYRRAFVSAGFGPEVAAMLASEENGSQKARAVSLQLRRAMVCIDDATESAQRLVAAGADSIILYPTPADGNWDHSFDATIEHATSLAKALPQP